MVTVKLWEVLTLYSVHDRSTQRAGPWTFQGAYTHHPIIKLQ